MLRYVVPLIVAAAILNPYGTQAEETRPFEKQFLLGVGTHQGIGGAVGPRGYVPAINIGQIRQLGLTSFRDDFSWSDFELPGGKLGFAAPLGRLETQLKSGVATPLLILGSSHYLVPNSNPPTTDEARRRFVEYAVAAAQSVANRNPLFELWNEWNISTRQDAHFDAQTYLLLARATYPVLKQVLPNAPFIVGAIGDDPGWSWTESLLQLGLLKYADGISIHLYNHCARVANRTAAEVIERLTKFRQLVSQASGNPDFPIYLTETGWPTATAKCGVSEKAQADNIAQLILWASTSPSWFKGMWLYELKDSGTNPSDLEDNFGIYHFDNSPKLAACAVRDSWAFIRSSLHAEASKRTFNVSIIRSNSDLEQKIAIWSDDPTRNFEIRIKDNSPGTYKYPCGELKPTAHEWLRVSSSPVLINLERSATPEFEVRQIQ